MLPPPPIMPKRALISVSDKTGLVTFANALQALNIEMISTGGTAQHLIDHDIPVTEVASITRFPEMMGGRVKTLHPNIFAAILGRRDQDEAVAQQHHIHWIDLVICNLYPFAATIQNPQTTFEQAIENIDIGGPSLLRAAAKNMAWTTVVTDPNDYANLLEPLNAQQGISWADRQHLATKAFAHTAHYDSLIARYLRKQCHTENQPLFPSDQPFTVSSPSPTPLRYGENPSQQAAAYCDPLQPATGLLQATQHQGKALSYNNILDGDSALNCLLEFDQPACVVVKHNTPCGVSSAPSLQQAFEAAWAADSQSAFGGIVALNRPLTVEIAEFLSTVFFELLLIPDYAPHALAKFSAKPNLRILQVDMTQLTTQPVQPMIRSIRGGWLTQAPFKQTLQIEALPSVTQQSVTDTQLADLAFAWKVVKHVKSNAIVIAQHQTTLGIGSGQVSRIDAVELAIRKGHPTKGAVLASDAFFPFRDSIDRLADAGIHAIIQPGGSLRDQAVIEACNEHGIAMIFTGERCFYH